MKKILISVLIVLLIIMAYFAIFKGLSIGSFQILSVEEINDENDKLTQQIEQTQILMNSAYPEKDEELKKSVENLLAARNEYRDLANVSTDSELKEANQEEEYTVEFLWTALGRHATKHGVNLSYTTTTGTTGDNSVQNISFTVSGTYRAVITFVSAIEDDSKLGFRIRNFKLVPGGSSLQATFTVTNVRIKPENASSPEVTTNNGAEQTTPQQESNQTTIDGATGTITQ
ncbi:MAG: hypothetical protein HFJ28_05725 [Clostridia bacterium]|jgi:uncharacterized protein YxeA|nr:hypothetical protein [Clostridia bacterium]